MVFYCLVYFTNHIYLNTVYMSTSIKINTVVYFHADTLLLLYIIGSTAEVNKIKRFFFK